MMKKNLDSIVNNINKPTIYYVINRPNDDEDFLVDKETKSLLVTDTAFNLFLLFQEKVAINVKSHTFESMMEIANKYTNGKFTVFDNPTLFDKAIKTELMSQLPYIKEHKIKHKKRSKKNRKST